MIFGRVALAEAVGARLAHSLRIAGGALRKGTLLGPAEVAALAAAGHADVVVARLERGEQGEDEAASAVATAVAGDGIAVGPAATGRCNLLAASRGLLVLRREEIDRLNGIDEAVTVATLAPFTLVETGALVATVKVIPFGVPDSVVAAWLESAARGARLGVAPLARKEAGLLLTRLPGMPEALLDAAARSIRARLSRLGCEVTQERRTAHEEGAAGAALRELLASGASPILVLGASATLDRADVIPRAIVEAGGVVERLGMPVDPGNLLVLARHGDVPVVGVPGCARSPLPSGFDAVLERLLADLPVTSQDLSAMGVGGLLKEIPGRPQPRRGAPESGAPAGNAAPRRSEKAIAAVVLAAGRSRRMEGRNKLLADVGGAPMIARVVDALLASPVSPVVVVLGHDADAVRAALGERPVRTVVNPRAAEGMSTSLRVGLDAVGEVDGALVCLGDMPWVRPEHVAALRDAFDPLEGRGICVPFHDGKRGNPVLWASAYFAEMRELAGDTGARDLLERHADAVWSVPVADAGVTLDVDTREALDDLTRRFA